MSTPQETVEIPQNGDPTQGAPVEPTPKPGDIISRIRSDPDFAVETFKKAQANGTKLAQELKTLAPLKEIVSRLDGGSATAAQMLYEHAALLNHPEVRTVADHYRRTGTLPTASARQNDPSDDEYVDPVEALKRDLVDVKAQLSSFVSTSQRDRGLLVQTTTKSHLTKLAEKHAAYWSVLEPFILEQAEEWERTPQGREILVNANFDTWDNLAGIGISRHLDEVLAAKAEHASKQRADLGTEPRPNTVTTGREGVIQQADIWRPGSARRWMEEVMRRDGRLR